MTIIIMIGVRQGKGSKDVLSWGREGGKSGPEASYKKIQNYIFNFAEMLGQGNFSKVYRGCNEITNEVVAIKIIELNSLKSKKLEELLFSEIDILKKLKHPNILNCHEVFTSNRNCYIITEICNEGDLESKLKQTKFMSEAEAEPYIKAVFKGLAYMSQYGIVHRDIKVSNIFIHNGQAKIADFGFAKATRSKFKDINIGSPIYMSPEGFIDNVYGPKTDIWAFGILIYELLHGQTPYSHCKSESELKYNLKIPIGWSQLKAELSTDIKEVILKCLQVEEHKRITAAQLGDLAFFKNLSSDSPLKNRRGLKDFKTGFSYDFTSLTTLKNDSNMSYKTEGDFMYDPKQRIKTQIQSYSKKIERDLSSGYAVQKYNREEKDVSKINREASSYIFKGGYEEDRAVRNSSSSNQFSGYRGGLMALNKVNSVGKVDAILSSAITFRECVNILHYCRLIFKHLMLMKQKEFGDDNQRSIFKRWLSTVLKSLMREIEQKKILCDGENILAREKKLEEVTTEYMKKYSKELDLDFKKIRLQQSAVINYQKICNYFMSVHQLIDQLAGKDPSNTSYMHLAHSMVMIVSSSKVMKQCYDERNYCWVQKFKQIEDFLGTKKDNFDYTSYQWYKKKYLL